MDSAISGWHNISANVPSIELDKVTFEDLASIINSIRRKHNVTDLESLKDEMFKHLVDLDNPHETNMDQLKVQVIDYFYNTWLSQGNYGTKDQFLEIIFAYTTYSTWKDMLNGLNYWVNNTQEALDEIKKYYEYLENHPNDSKEYSELLNSVIVFYNDYNYRIQKDTVWDPIIEDYVLNKSLLEEENINYIYYNNLVDSLKNYINYLRKEFGEDNEERQYFLEFYEYLNTHNYSKIVPTVKDFYDYLVRHDTGYYKEDDEIHNENTHEELLELILPYKDARYNEQNIFTYNQYVGIPLTVEWKFDNTVNKYVDIPVSSLAFPSKATVFLHGKYKTDEWFKLRNETSHNYYFSVKIDAEKNEVIFSTTDSSGFYKNSLIVSTANLLQDINDKHDRISIAMQFDGNDLYGYVWLTGTYMQIPIKSKLQEFRKNNILSEIKRYPKDKRHTYNSYLTLSGMHYGDNLETFSIYPFILNKEGMGYTFSIFEY